MAKKGVKVGPRQTVEWGTVKRKVAGKTVNVKLTSQVLETTAKAFGLKKSAAATSAATTKTIKTKKGNRVVLSGGIAKVATRKFYASIDGKVWHQLPVPAGTSLAKASATMKAGKLAYAVKFQGGTARIIGKISKDTKTKSKAAAK